MDIATLRKEYRLARLDESTLAQAPHIQFERWLNEALKARLPEPTAMTLATVSAQGQPAARIVLLKGHDERGFVFFTNYESRKGRELARQPLASLLFHWTELERQVRIDGQIARVSTEESDAYFRTRPLESQLGAWASPQSEVIGDRDSLLERFAAARSKYGESVPRPAHWGGFRLQPQSVEFWQGRESRLHDRLRYHRLPEGGWTIERLAP